MASEPRTTPLHQRHLESGARMMRFAGFEMPLQYRSIMAEHRAVRLEAGIFDISHMGEIRIRGRQALALTQRLFTNDVAGTALGRVRYGMLCVEDGGVVDDVILYRVGEDEVLLCVNAANTESDLDWIREVHAASDLDCDVIDESPETALLAVQGPKATGIVGRLLAEGSDGPRRWRFRPLDLAEVPVLLSRTGYTGEDGYEIYAPADQAVTLWDALLEAGGDVLHPAGLGARDTLRTEMGFPLYGHELSREHNPLEAGLERIVDFKRDFIGRDALSAVRERGPERRLVGLRIEGRAVARPGHPILADDPVGVVTSGTFGPSVERSIAMGYVPVRYASVGTRLSVEIRSRRVACEVTPTPFHGRER